jgi:hypothetical protein
MEKIGAALERCGWRRRFEESYVERFEHAAPFLFEHSVHYIHDEWPCDLDIHYNFPGFFAPEDVVFGALWERHVTAEVAHWPVPSADLLGQAMIVALHVLRDDAAPSAHPDFMHLVARLRRLDRADLADLSRLAATSGADVTLAPLLREVGAPLVGGPWADAPRKTSWEVRAGNARLPVTPWLIEVGRTPWRRRPRLLVHALWLPTDELMSQHVGASRSRASVLRLQARRWRRALRHLRAAMRSARRYDASVR